LENLYSAPQADLSQVPAMDDSYEPKIFSFAGRIGRLRYLAYHLAVTMLIYMVAGALTALVSVLSLDSAPNFGLIGVLGIIGFVAFFGAMMTATLTYVKRRLNDLDQSGWWGILMIIPFINFFFGLYLVFAPGTKGSNSYGPAPCKNSTGVIIGGMLFPLIFVVGILAAIALPAYKDYKDRAKAAEARTLVVPD
jgi:uncharacterized membrane protein YhaH (DUF805 family)